ncbi:hypothetical protein C0992_001284, partial [Termitomyces sp. T32_za158]
MGVDVGDYFVDRRLPLGKTHIINKSTPKSSHDQDHDRPAIEISIEDAKDPKTVPLPEKAPPSRRGRHGGKDPKDQSINCLVYKDPF